MASVYKRGNKFYAQWYRPCGQHTSRSTGSTKRREAERIAAEFEAADHRESTQEGVAFERIIRRAGLEAKACRLSSERAEQYLEEIRRIADPNYRIITLEQHLEEWCSEKASRVSASTAAGYRDMQRRFTLYIPRKARKAPLSELTRQHIEAAMRKMQSAGLRGSTINLDLRALRQCLKQALDDGTITRNVASGIQSMPETDSAERAPFTAAEVRALIDHPQTTQEWRGLILFGAHTGLRLGDIAGLTAKNIAGTYLVIRPEKTSRTRKTVSIPLTPPLLSYVAGKKGKIFPKASTTATATLSMQFRAIMKRAEIPHKIQLPGGIQASRSYHSLRHTFATWLAEADIHADIRKKLTGHSSETSHAIYSHHDEALQRAINTLPDIGTA